ncbi:MAG: trimethylamine methyltransferase family protein [Bacillota bacterium]|jgi:trimethylamine--corrinoid protein Co-methyltransferase
MTGRSARTGVTLASGFGLLALTRDQLDSLHYATLEVFRNTGIKVDSEEAVEMFHGAGAKVERRPGQTIVKIPPYVVEDCIQWTPSTTVYYGREPEDDFVAEPNRVGFSTFGECVKVIDIHTRQARRSVKEDVAQVTRVCDYLDEISVMERPLCSSDCLPATQPLHNLDALLNNTSKHVFTGAGNGANCRKMVEMAAASVGGAEVFRERPNLTVFVCPTSPLMLVEECCEAIIETARGGAGVAVIPMALAGATSTVTLAGTLVTHNAETLSALVLAQLARKGTACTYCSMSTIMDLRLMVGAVGSPEHGMISAGAINLAQYYRLPSWVGGGVSDSKIPDAQSGYEYTLNAVLGALAGANIVYGVGALEMGLTIDFAKLILDAEMIRYIRKVTGGIDFSDETLALDLIHQVGPAGEFMTSEHTFRHMRKQSQPRLFDRRTRNAWSAEGSRDAAERAYEEAQHILKTHKPIPMVAGAAQTIRAIIEDYEAEILRGHPGA